MSTPADELTDRERALLRAVADGRGELTCSCEPDLYIDGRSFCDQSTAHRLVHTGLIGTDILAPRYSRVPATLTATGRAVLEVPA